MKLKEGSRYIFDVSKCVELDKVSFFVLTGPDNRKYLLNKDEYSNYNIVIGEKIDCRVDKINCKGEYFLEPLHPYYKEGHEYDFSVKSIEDMVNMEGERVLAARLSGIMGDEVILDKSYFKAEIPKVGSSVSFRIHKISKGQIFIGDNKPQKLSAKEEDKEIYDFLLLGESPGLDNKNYYIVEDNSGRRYTIRKDYYIHYKLRAGESFKGRFIRYKDGSEVNIEPVNPWFNPGSSYLFRVKKIVKYADAGGFIVLEDSYNSTHKVAFRDNIAIGDKLYYKVVKMRKGWPLLEEM